MKIKHTEILVYRTNNQETTEQLTVNQFSLVSHSDATDEGPL